MSLHTESLVEVDEFHKPQIPWACQPQSNLGKCNEALELDRLL